MDSLLQEITILPGVLGCFVFNKNGQIEGSKMPPIFNKNSIQGMGTLVSRTIQIGNMAQLYFKNIEIKYNESILLIKLLPGEALLIIICEPNANKSLISMTTEMLAQDIEAAMTVSRTSTPVNQSSTAAPAPQAVASNEPKKVEAELDSAMAPMLEEVKDALAMAIGPIAGPIMKDTLEIWLHQGPPSPANIPDLAKLLCIEINDDVLEEEFIAAVKNILK
ncbi:MAG: hypothetical protein KAR01_09325 [Desulfocapsa sp.]|nr:hypothetical protein [Desulfocapsa sp.]